MSTAADYALRLRGLAADEADLLLDASENSKARLEAAATSAFCLDLADRFDKICERGEYVNLAGRVEDALGFLDRLENLNPLGMVAVADVVRNVREYLGGEQ